MAEVTVYGASDDLIEVDGDITEEFGAYYSEEDEEGCPSFLAFSDGTLLEVRYGNPGIWRVNRVGAGSAEYERKEATDPDSEDYSDRVTLRGDLRWVLFGRQVVLARKRK